MNYYAITKPIGLKKSCDEIERICGEAAAYRHGAKLKNLIIPIDSGSGRTTLIEYMADMFKTYGVLDCVCSMDDYIEVTVDASSQRRVENTFTEIREAADYDNDYSNIVGMDISDVANYIGQPQYKDFLTKVTELSNSAFVVLFVHSDISRNEEVLLRDIIEKAGNDRFVRLPPETYSNSEICALIKKRITEFGICIKDEDKFSGVLSGLISELGITNVPEAVSLSDSLLHYADYSENMAKIDNRSIMHLVSNNERKNTK